MNKRRFAFSRKTSQVCLTLFLLVGGILIIFPIIWATLSAFKPYQEIISIPPKFFSSSPTLEHFAKLLFIFPYWRLLFNSFFIAGVSCLSSVIFSTMVGYGLAKFRSPGLDIIFIILLTSIMVPFFICVIPLYVTMVKLGGENTYWGVIAPSYVSTFGIFLMRQHAMGIPNELLDSARIDGASEPRILLAIVFPLMRAAWVTLLVIKFLYVWNDFLWPLVMLSRKEMMTLPIALATFKGHLITYYGPLLAGAVTLLLPVLILFLILQRQIVQGITLSGLK